MDWKPFAFGSRVAADLLDLLRAASRCAVPSLASVAAVDSLHPDLVPGRGKRKGGFDAVVELKLPGAVSSVTLLLGPTGQKSLNIKNRNISSREIDDSNSKCGCPFSGASSPHPGPPRGRRLPSLNGVAQGRKRRQHQSPDGGIHATGPQEGRQQNSLHERCDMWEKA